MRTGVLQRLGGDLAELAALDPATLPDQDLLDALRELHPLLCRVQAVQTRLIGAAHRRGAAAADGAASTQAWLRCRLHLGDAATQIRVATGLAQLPALATAYQQGKVSFAHAAAVVDVTRDISPQVLAAGADSLLTGQAQTRTPAVTRRAAIRVRDYFHPEAAERRAARLYEDRWLCVDRTIHGAVSVQGVLDPDGGSLLLATLGALMPPPIPGETRSPGARRADALVQLCRLAGTAAPESGGQKPHVAVTIDWDTLRGGLTPALRTPGGRWTGASLGGDTPVHAATARRMACDALLIPALLGSTGEPLDLGRATRVVSPGLRRALVLRDGGCRFPGCDRPPQWTDAHHIIHWAQGGPTNLTNTTLLCRAHHTMIHEGGWRITLHPDTNTVTVHRPDGHPHDLVSHPRAQSP